MNKQWLFAKEEESRFSFVLSIWPWKTITLFLRSNSYFHRLLIILLSFYAKYCVVLTDWRLVGYVSYSCHSNSWICSACITSPHENNTFWHFPFLLVTAFVFDVNSVTNKICMFHRKETFSFWINPYSKRSATGLFDPLKLMFSEHRNSSE